MSILILSTEEAEQLYECLWHTYISHTKYPLVHKILRRIQDEILQEKKNGNDKQ